MEILKNIKYIGLLLAGFAFFSCNKPSAWDCVKKTGPQTEEVRTIDGFTKLEVRGHVNVVIRQAEEFSVIVKGGRNLLPQIITQTQGKSLLIENTNTCDWVRNLKQETEVEIYMPELDELVWKGTGRIRGEGIFNTQSILLQVWRGGESIDMQLNADTIYVKQHGGVGDVILGGNCNYLFMYNISWGLSDCLELKSREVHLHQASANQMLIQATDRISGKILNSGDVLYKGVPEDIQVEEYASGKLKALP